MLLFDKIISMLKSVTKPRKKPASGKNVAGKSRRKSPPVLLPILNSPGNYLFYCPACEESHLVHVAETAYAHGHHLSGSLAKPTITPSILSYGDKKTGKPRCHSFITKGKIKFMTDCSHAFAGMTVTLKPLE
jgi:Family of unknown function (DUF6527)